MGLKFTYSASDGSEGTLDSSEIQNYLIDAGMQAIVSPDGTTATIIQNGQEFEGPVADLVSQYYGPVKSVLPAQDATDYSTIDNTLKSGIAQFGSDSLKAKYLQLAMQNAGIEDAKIVGSGDDWFRYDPASQTYLALTNRPGAELSDVLTYAPQIARTVGSIVGGVAGSGVGLAGGGLPAIATGAAGSAIGGQFGARGAEVIQRLIDPNYAQTIGNLTSEESSERAKEKALEIGLDALTGGITSIPLKPLQTYLAKGGITRAATFGSRGVEATGKAVENLAGITAKSDLARALATQVASPTLGTAQAAGWIAQAPQFLTTKGTELTGKALNKLGYPQQAKMFEGLSTGRGVLDPLERALSRYKSFFQGADQSPRTQARDVLGNLGERIGQRTLQKGMQRAEAQGLTGKALAEETARLGRQSKNFARAGEQVGRVFDATATLGRGVEQTVDFAAKAGLRGLQYGGKALGEAGRIGRMTGDVLRPLEGRALLQGARYYGEENFPY